MLITQQLNGHGLGKVGVVLNRLNPPQKNSAYTPVLYTTTTEE